MRIVVPTAIIVCGMYGLALYGPVPFTTQGLLAGIAVVFVCFVAAYYAFDGLDSRDSD